MSVIQVLDREVAQLIAAGEVVERPSSVIKELVENSIDAGATLVTVEIKNGGVTYMRVSDNGCGIAPDDVPKVFLRHATSKVRNEEDLAHIATLGFRGEAMASINAVCQVEMLTKMAGALEGTRYAANGGEEIELSPAGCPTGTTLIARNLFFNTPARMKFLKKDVTEANSVAAVVEKAALSHPEVSFKFLRDGQLRLHTPGDGKLLSAVRAVMGKEFTDGVIPVDYMEGQIKVTGYITKPAAARSNRTMQNFFINGRYVKSRTAAAALEEAYKHSIMVGKFPGCVLSLELPFTETDVNVHPSKIEVRFTNEKPVFDAVYYGVKNALAQYDTRPNIEQGISEGKRPLNQLELKPQAAVTQQKLTEASAAVMDRPQVQPQKMSAEEYRALIETSSKKRYEPTSIPRKTAAFQRERSESEIDEKDDPQELADSGEYRAYTASKQRSAGPLQETEAIRPAEEIREQVQPDEAVQQEGNNTSLLTEEETRPSPENGANLQEEDGWEAARLIGELFSTYIILEHGDEMILIDKHAAHERLIFNQLKQKSLSGDRQLLLEPVMVSLSREDYQGVLDQIDVFQQIGFLVEDFGSGDLIVREIPVLLPEADIREIVEETAHSLALQKNDLTPSALDELLHSVACKSAVRAGDQNKLLELQELVRLLQEDQSVRYCPHGRPIAKSFSKREIEKLFGRIQ